MLGGLGKSCSANPIPDPLLSSASLSVDLPSPAILPADSSGPSKALTLRARYSTAQKKKWHCMPDIMGVGLPLSKDGSKISQAPREKANPPLNRCEVGF